MNKTDNTGQAPQSAGSYLVDELLKDGYWVSQHTFNHKDSESDKTKYDRVRIFLAMFEYVGTKIQRDILCDLIDRAFYTRKACLRYKEKVVDISEDERKQLVDISTSVHTEIHQNLECYACATECVYKCDKVEFCQYKIVDNKFCRLKSRLCTFQFIHPTL